jgi:hypothetical protein
MKLNIPFKKVFIYAVIMTAILLLILYPAWILPFAMGFDAPDTTWPYVLGMFSLMIILPIFIISFVLILLGFVTARYFSKKA